jgi:undecaprenyl phosphate-alpha-L-ara4N flippase subunit ArnF
MSRVSGMAMALSSVALVSAAQLGMRWSMTRLPLPSQWQAAWGDGSLSGQALAVVSLSIGAYALSMACWLSALRDMPLGRAYALLSISYALVYVLAASLPMFDEHFSLLKTLGVTAVVLGVITINSPRRDVSRPRITP